MDKRFQEQAISFAFLESQVTILHKDLEQLSKRTKEDASVIVKELFKLTNRVEQLEQFVKKNKSRLLAA